MQDRTSGPGGLAVGPGRTRAGGSASERRVVHTDSGEGVTVGMVDGWKRFVTYAIHFLGANFEFGAAGNAEMPKRNTI